MSLNKKKCLTALLRLNAAYRVVVALLALMVCACGDADNEPDSINDMAQNGGLRGTYVGEWSIDGSNDIESVVTIYDTGFSFKQLPLSTVLTKALPLHDVEQVADVGYMVPCEEMAFTEQASYYAVRPIKWTTRANIDGTWCNVSINFESNDGTHGTGSVATFSRLSGVYKIVLQTSSIEVEAEDGAFETYVSNASLKLSFVTKRRI